MPQFNKVGYSNSKLCVDYSDPLAVRAYYQKIIDCMPNNVYWLDKNCITQGCNKNVLKLVGLESLDQFVGITYEEMGRLAGWAEGQAESFKKDDMEVLTTGIGKYNVDEPPVYDEHGNPRFYISSRVPVLNDKNEVIGVVGISVDITDRKKAEQQLAEAIHAKSTFLNIVSHEIKGPLSNAIYILKMLKEEIENNTLDKNECLQLINTQLVDAYRGVEIINYLHKFLSLHEPKHDKIVNLNLGKELVELIDLFEQDNQKNLLFSLINNENLPPMIVLNRDVFEVIKILLVNAVKYSKRNGEINIRLASLIKNSSSYLSISVEDNGQGMSEEMLNNLFTPLFNSSQLEKYNAPAIKLSYAKKMMETLGGTLDIKSQLGKGTQVTVTVVYERSKYEATISHSMKYSNLEKMKLELHRKLNFLVIEDNPVTSQLLREKLISLHHEVDVAFNAMDARKLAGVRNYDVIFMDISLPGENGVELRKKLSNGSDDKPIIIAITSHNSESDIDYFIEQGFAAVIGKPFTDEDIDNCIAMIQINLADEDF